ncbi:dihydrofolate reductase family protein [Microlunatus speluncae]|uniref:dihydrofolate reductase family protein n=1 Tax=Microlunatus speluncae TaxID=2594267 RepID=UPI0012660801|nr:dihydrofolate reductase family protein [Microlunatus speluncae]
MRKIIVCNIVSVDGYFTDPDGNPPFAGMDEFFDGYNLERITAATTVLLGRRSYEFFGGYWPAVADAPVDPADRSLDEVNRGISRGFNQVQKVAVSDDFAVPDDHPWRDRTTVVTRAGVAGWLAAAKESGEGDIVIFASRTLWNALLSQGLVDEVHLMIAPVAYGGGTPAFDGQVPLALSSARQAPGSNNALLVYRPAAH